MVINLFGCQGLFLRVMSDSNKKQYKKVNKNGFTLVEVMVSVAVFAILSIVLGVILNVGLKSWKEVNAKTESERDLNRAVNDINFSLRNSMDSKSLNKTGLKELTASKIDIGNNSESDGMNKTSDMLKISFISVLGMIPTNFTFSGGLSMMALSSL